MIITAPEVQCGEYSSTTKCSNISSILGSGTSEMFPLVAESTLLTCGLKVIYFSEINTHSPPGGFTRSGFLGNNNNWTGPWTEALF